MTEELPERVKAGSTASAEAINGYQMKRDPCPQSNWMPQALGASSSGTEYGPCRVRPRNGYSLNTSQINPFLSQNVENNSKLRVMGQVAGSRETAGAQGTNRQETGASSETIKQKMKLHGGEGRPAVVATRLVFPRV